MSSNKASNIDAYACARVCYNVLVIVSDWDQGTHQVSELTMYRGALLSHS